MSGVSGLVGLVTGAGSGIGRATAVEFARRGAAVGVLDRDEDAAVSTTAAIRDEGGDARAITVDIGDERSVRHALDRFLTSFGRLDFAVNNAGIAAPDQPLAEIDLADWERVVRVDLTGTFLCMKYELPALVDRGGGAIVNVASNGGLTAIPHKPAYVASKHGVVGLSKVAAVDYARHNIRVNSLCPSPTRTAMYEAVSAGTDMTARQEAATPLGRLADPEEVAAAAVWLCSPESSYVTGIALPVDGGRTS